MKVRRPSSEGRTPKDEIAAGRRAAGSSDIGVRASDFGLRGLLAIFLTLTPTLLLAAETNAPAPDAIPTLRPARGELSPTFWERYGIWVITGGLIVVALALIAAWFMARPKPAAVTPPEAQARRALEPLGDQPEDGALLSRVSQILRQYIAAAFHLPAGEFTTTEFCREIAQHKEIGLELAAALSDFLHQCDQRKFSPPAPVSPLSAVTKAVKLIERAEARRAAAQQPGAPTDESPEEPAAT